MYDFSSKLKIQAVQYINVNILGYLLLLMQMCDIHALHVNFTLVQKSLTEEKQSYACINCMNTFWTFSFRGFNKCAKEVNPEISEDDFQSIIQSIFHK